MSYIKNIVCFNKLIIIPLGLAFGILWSSSVLSFEEKIEVRPQVYPASKLEDKAEIMPRTS